MKKAKIVYVEWEDSASAQGWMKAKDAKKYKVAQCMSVGFVLRDTKKKLLLCTSLWPDNSDACQLMCIPKSSITKIEHIRDVVAQ